MFGLRSAAPQHSVGKCKMTPIFRHVDIAEFAWREASHQEQDDGREAARISRGIHGQGGPDSCQGSTTRAQLASQFGIHTTPVTTWKKLMGNEAKLLADGRQRRAH